MLLTGGTGGGGRQVVRRLVLVPVLVLVPSVVAQGAALDRLFL